MASFSERPEGLAEAPGARDADALGDALADALADALGLGAAAEALADALDDALGFGTGAALVGGYRPHTGRKSSSAVRCTRLTNRSWLTPGTETTIAAPSPDPCVVTSASDTPRPSTRWRMMFTVC